MSIRDLGRSVDYIGSAKNIGSFLVHYIGYWFKSHIGVTLPYSTTMES